MAPSTRKLLIVFCALLVVTLAYSMLERRRTTSRTTTFVRVNVEDITRIEVRGDDGVEVAMELQADRWVIVSPITYPANQANVQSLLDKVGELSVTNLVSSNPANHELYEVGIDSGTLVRLLGGRDGSRRLLTFYVGGITTDISGTYIREFGVDEVFAASGLLRGYFDKTLSAWRDRTVLTLPPDEITALSVASTEYSFMLTRRGMVPGGPDAAWILQTGGEAVAADSTMAARLIRTAASLSASDFPPAGTEANIDWEVPATRIEMTLSTGDRVGITVIPIPDDESRSYVRKDGDDTVFIVYRSTLDSIARDPESLRAQEPGL